MGHKELIEKDCCDTSGTCRDSAASVLRGIARKMHAEAQQLDALADLAQRLAPGTPEDEALWKLAIERRR